MELDAASLKKRYYDLSRKFHPDFYQKATPAERQIATERSALLNKAYETLRDPFLRAEYILDLEGIIDLKKDLGPVAADLLAEVFEIQENISAFLGSRGSAGADERMHTLENELAGLLKRQKRIEQDLKRLFHEWDELAEKKELAEKMLRLLHEKRYIDTAIQNIHAGLKK